MIDLSVYTQKDDGLTERSWDDGGQKKSQKAVERKRGFVGCDLGRKMYVCDERRLSSIHLCFSLLLWTVWKIRCLRSVLDLSKP